MGPFGVEIQAKPLQHCPMAHDWPAGTHGMMHTDPDSIVMHSPPLQQLGLAGSQF